MNEEENNTAEEHPEEKDETRKLLEGLFSLPAFPVVLVTVKRNIMTAAAFHFYSFNPPSVMVGIIPENFTYELIRETGEFAINLPTQYQTEAVRICGRVSGREADKFEKAGLTPQKGKVIESFLIKECPAKLECKVVHEIPYKGSHAWFIGEIKEVHIDEDYTRDLALLYWPFEYRILGSVLMSEEKKKK